MEKIYTKARAKINLTLNVLNKRADNYHNLESVFQKINLYDELVIEKIKDNKFELKTNVEEINNNDNILYKAYMELKKYSDKICGVKVNLKKTIPMQAGLGGGSADCANFILAMNKLFELNLSEKTMREIGEKLGADVVPCFFNQAIVARGKGEFVTKVDTIFRYYIIIIKPKFSCSTAKMYKKIDEKNINQPINTESMIKALETGNICEISNNLYNVFEEVVEERKEINEIKEILLKEGAIGSLLCGSGSCVFGLFENKSKAKETYSKLKEIYNIYICTSYNRKEKI